ncbi:hypothetical protein AX17_007305 [Amanita inopinata Kibby_2008]|nr:hypothetical protein AX17_007305 [Amanita inopinata Kibby_2008]
MSLYHQSSSSKVSAPRTGLTEFDILKASHKFLRDEEQGGENSSANPWNEQLAEKYYASLYREFAVCDLKHYKSGNFALRWRTEDEVLSGAGESTCGNTRCEHHQSTSPLYDLSGEANDKRNGPPLTTLELPFTYEEHGEQKSALVKVVLCGQCVRKLMWRRNKDKERAMEAERERQRERATDGDAESGEEDKKKRRREKSKEPQGRRQSDGDTQSREKDKDRRKRFRHEGEAGRSVDINSEKDEQHRHHHRPHHRH